MQRTKKRNKAALVLPVLLVGSGILVACIGLFLKAKLKEDGRYGEQMAVAVPFLMMQERDSLKPLQSPITEPLSTTFGILGKFESAPDVFRLPPSFRDP